MTNAPSSPALALVTLATEANTSVVGFTAGSMWREGISPLPLSARQRLDDAVRSISGIPFGGTDCSLPMLHAAQNDMDVDAFIIYTDSETWRGRIHPFQALQQYRAKTGINARCIVVGMTSNGFSIADPDDGGMLDIVGFDSSCPTLISDFIKR